MNDLNRLLRNIAWLLVPFAMVLFFVEYRLRRIPNSYSDLAQTLEHEEKGIEVFTTGSSHMYTGIDVSCFDAPAVNLAHTSQSLHYDTALVMKYAPQAKALRWVIFGLSYFSFETRLDRGVESWRVGFYKQVFNLPGEHNETRFALLEHSYIMLYTPRHAYDLVWRDLVGQPIDPEDANKRLAAAGGGDVSDKFAATRVHFHEATMYPSFIEENRRSLQEACQWLEGAHVHVLLVTAPVDRSYAQRVDPVRYARMQQNASDMARVCHALYINYFFDARFEAADFQNSDHLNERGAAKFTRLLNERIRQDPSFPSD